MKSANENSQTKTHAYERIGADALESLLRRPMGLIIGPGITLGAGCLADLARDLASHFSVTGPTHLLATCDAIVAKGTKSHEIRERVRSRLKQGRAAGSVSVLAKSRWSAVLSACYGSFFEHEHQTWCDRAPTRAPVTTIDDLRQPIPPRSVPVYKLLGSAHRDDFVVTSNDYRIRQQSWQRVLKDFCGFVQGAPVLCIGLAECPWVVLDLLASMVYDTNLTPGSLLVLSDDPLVGNEQVRELADKGVRVLRVDATLGDVVSAATRSRKAAYTAPLPLHEADLSIAERLEQFIDLAVVINFQTTSHVGVDEVHRLRDLLFSPTAPSWEPYYHKLDFPRTTTSAVRKAVDGAINDKSRHVSGVVVSGPAACGKTTILKRVAYDLACEDHLVLWMRPYFFQDGQAAVRKLFECIKETKAHGGRPVVTFVDDPIGLGSIRIDDLSSVARSTGIDTCFVVAQRTSDALTDDLGLTSDRALEELQVPDRFDDDEWKRLPAYLVHLGVCASLKDGETQVSNAPHASAQDVLAMLFWLLPETRNRITSSIRNEHLRLGDRLAFSRLLAGELRGTTDVLREAYELVAVGADYGASVPMEVLVTALGVSFESWLTLSRPQGLLWGLLYAEGSVTSQSVLYRPRNRIVTDIIVETINGGVLGHSGELVRLRKLIDACNGSAPAYREFCVRLLVPSDRKRLQGLEYVEGLDLYDRAIAALPHEDRTLMHHKGLWQKNKGNDYAEAKKTLEAALRTHLYPYAARGEALEHIYTSLAANQLDALKAKAISPSEGKETVLGYLDRARSGTFLNPNAVHVQAKMIVGLADVSGASTEPDSVKLIESALSEIDRMLLLLLSQFRNDRERRSQLDMLKDARSEVLDRCVPLDQLRKDAEEMWVKSRRQDGFVLCGRKLFGIALGSNKGTDFKIAFDHCRLAADKIEGAGDLVTSNLRELMLHIYFHWRVRRRIMSEATDAIEWGIIGNLASEVMLDIRNRTDPFYAYIVALAKAHLGDWSGAHALFDDLRTRQMPRDFLHEPRDFLMNDKGGMARVQGLIVAGAGKQFLKVDTLRTDFLLDRESRWARAGETEHAYVRFSFAGPLAVKEP